MKSTARVWTRWGRVGAVALTLTVLLTSSCDDRSQPGEAAPPPAPTPAPIKQAKWEIKTFPSGALHGLTHKKKKQLRAEKPALRQLVKKVYDDLFLNGGTHEVVRRAFTERAAAAILRSGAAVSDRLSDLRTTLRRARIGIGAESARQAAVEVWLRARAGAGDNKVHIFHRSTLWLQKTRGRWRAIAFEIKQGPAA
jgi:hypothetical protein